MIASHVLHINVQAVVFLVAFAVTLAGAAPAAADSAAPLTWAPPQLDDPTVIEVASGRNTRLNLEPDRDYILRIVEPITSSGGLVVNGRGARHIVLIGGEFDIPHQGPFNDPDRPFYSSKRRALYIKNWKGVVHLEGLWLRGEDLAEGIDLASEYDGAIAQVQNIRVEDVVSRPEEKAVNYHGVHHPDILQTWAGPAYLRIDRFTGSSECQGIFLGPLDNGGPMQLADLRRINLNGIGPEGGRYLVWRKGGEQAVRQINVSDVWVNPGPERIARRIPVIWPHLDRDPVWQDVQEGVPPGGDFVPRGVAGMDYRSPGYVAAESPPEP